MAEEIPTLNKLISGTHEAKEEILINDNTELTTTDPFETVEEDIITDEPEKNIKTGVKRKIEETFEKSANDLTPIKSRKLLGQELKETIVKTGEDLQEEELKNIQKYIDDTFKLIEESETTTKEKIEFVKDFKEAGINNQLFNEENITPEVVKVTAILAENNFEDISKVEEKIEEEKVILKVRETHTKQVENLKDFYVTKHEEITNDQKNTEKNIEKEVKVQDGKVKKTVAKINKLKYKQTTLEKSQADKISRKTELERKTKITPEKYVESLKNEKLVLDNKIRDLEKTIQLNSEEYQKIEKTEKAIKEDLKNKEKEIKKIESNNKKRELKMIKLTNDINTLKTELVESKEKEKILLNKTRQLEKFKSSSIEKLEKSTENLEKEQKKASLKEAQINEKLLKSKEEVKKLKLQITTSTAENKELTNKIEKANQQIIKLNELKKKEITKYNETLEKLTSTQKENEKKLNVKLEDEKEQSKKFKNKIEELENQQKKLKNDLDNSVKEIENKKKEAEVLKKQKLETDANIIHANERIRVGVEELKRLKESQNNTLKEVTALRKEKESLTTRLNENIFKYNEELSKLKVETATFDNQKKALQNQISNLESVEANEKKKLVDLKKEFEELKKTHSKKINDLIEEHKKELLNKEKDVRTTYQQRLQLAEGETLTKIAETQVKQDAIKQLQKEKKTLEDYITKATLGQHDKLNFQYETLKKQYEAKYKSLEDTIDKLKKNQSSVKEISTEFKKIKENIENKGGEDVDEVLEEVKENDPVLYRILKKTISLMPKPISSITLDTFGSEEDVKKSFQNIEDTLEKVVRIILPGVQIGPLIRNISILTVILGGLAISISLIYKFIASRFPEKLTSENVPAKTKK